MGNWELVSLAAARAGAPVAVVARRLKAPRVERRIVAFRQRFGVRTLLRGSPGASVAAYRWLRDGGVLGCMMDRLHDGPRLVVPLLGKATRMPLGPLELADGHDRVDRFPPMHHYEPDPARRVARQPDDEP